jgi:hypothetical protein
VSVETRRPRFRTNHIVDTQGPPRPSEPLSRRERALHRLRDVQATVEVIAGEIMEVTNFVFGGQGPQRRLEYFCTRCGAHVLVGNIMVEGSVTCACGPMTGRLL